MVHDQEQSEELIINSSVNQILSRRREVVFARISLYIVFVFIVCHSVKLIPNLYEMITAYQNKDDSSNVDFPIWMKRITVLSHFLLTLACSANYFIYFAKHGYNKKIDKRLMKSLGLSDTEYIQLHSQPNQ